MSSHDHAMKPRDRAVLSLFVGPAAALADQLTSYAALRYLFVVTAVSAALTMAAAYSSYRVLQRKTEVFPVDRFLGRVGLWLNAFFLLVIVFGFGIPKLLLHPTD